MKSCLIRSTVIHKRFIPKKYEFKASYFWFKLDLDELEFIEKEIPLIGMNRFSLYSFFESDHLKFHGHTLKNKVENYIKSKGFGDVSSISLITNLSFLGYVFNPVSFFLIDLQSGEQLAIIQVGNTFNEIKPFIVPPENFNDKGFDVSTKKLFYVSPFIQMDSDFVFSYKETEEDILINIDDFCEKELVLKAMMRGQKAELTFSNLVKLTLVYPFNTLKIIFLIHFHALVLFLKGIKYFKKTDHQDLQQGAQIWKN